MTLVKVEIISGLDFDAKIETWVDSFWGIELFVTTDITDTPESPFYYRSEG